MAHPKSRLWTLATLDRGEVYVLYFDPEAYRWDVRLYADTSGPLTTRPPTRSEGGVPPAAGKRSAGGRGVAPRPRDGRGARGAVV